MRYASPVEQWYWEALWTYDKMFSKRNILVDSCYGSVPRYEFPKCKHYRILRKDTFTAPRRFELRDWTKNRDGVFREILIPSQTHTLVGFREKIDLAISRFGKKSNFVMIISPAYVSVGIDEVFGSVAVGYDD